MGHGKIEKTLSYLICSKTKMICEFDVCYVLSKKEYELLGTHGPYLDIIARNILYLGESSMSQPL
jgi:hypothetical protein